MAKFSAADAAMTGFGVVRRTPSVLLWWTLFHILLTGGFSILMVIMAGPAMTQMMALQGTSITPDPQTQAQRFELFSQLAPLYLLMFPLSIAFYSVLYTAMNRAVLRPAQGAFGYLRLGVEELRQFGLFLLTFVMLICAYILMFILGLIAFAVIQLLVVKAAPGSSAPTFLGLGVGLLFLAAWIYVTTRLSLASPLTFDSKRVNLFGSWRITRGQFWPMFGAYVLTAFLALVVGLLGMVVLFACAAIASGGVNGFAFMFRPDMSSLNTYLTPARIVYLVLAGALYALVWPVFLTPRAAIYKALTAPKPTPVSWPSPEPVSPRPTPFETAPPETMLPEPGPVAPTPVEPSPESPSEPAPFCALPDDPEHP